MSSERALGERPRDDTGAAREERVSALWFAALLLRKRRALLLAVFVGAVLGALVAVLTPPEYTARFSFIPQGPQDANRSGLASLAGQFGVTLGGGSVGQSPQFYADLLQTRELL